MSYFERMMRLNQAEPRPLRPAEHPLPTDHSRRTDNEEQLARSRVSCSELEEELPEVPQQPKPQSVYVSVKPVLLSCLLPKREQLLRDMMAKKREFEMKKLANSNMVKGADLKHRLEESSFQFAHAQHARPKQHEEILLSSNSNKHGSSKKGLFASSQALANPGGQSHGKQGKKSMKESLVLDISTSSRHKQSECSNVGQSDPLNREIMMRLLSMLENERNDRKDLLAMSISNQFSHLPHEKETPIVINNILKTPVDALSKDLIEREMKIKMLENHRAKNKLTQHFTELTDNPLTQRSEVPRCQEFSGTEPKEFTAISRPHSKKPKISLECSRISVQSRQQEEEKAETAQRGVDATAEGKRECEDKYKATKPSSNFSSQMTETDAPSKSKQRERNFNRPRQAKKQEKNDQFDDKPEKDEVKNRQNQIPVVSQAIVHKASVRLDIPLSEGSQGQQLTLAQAFKKRIGKLRSEKEKAKKASATAESQNTPPLQLISDENFVKTELYPQYKTPKDAYLPLFPLESSQTVNLPKRRTPLPKRSAATAKEPETSSKNSREPSKDLIDRLIGGERAKVSKKEMYALTRKNYQNLPEIQAKKKEEQKRRLEQERLAKVRELQRSTRSMKQVKLSLE